MQESLLVVSPKTTQRSQALSSNEGHDKGAKNSINE